MNPISNTGSASFAIGAYTGNGLDDRSITNTGVTPDYVAIKSVGATAGVWRSDTMSGDYTSFFGPTAGANNHIQSLNTNGFQIGSNANINTAATLYHWFSFVEGTQFETGNYIGTGTSTPHTTAFAPGYILIKESTGVNPAVVRSSIQTGDSASPLTNLPTRTTAITSMDATGFTTGTDLTTNNNSVIYNYVAWILPDTAAPTAGITYSDSDSIVRSGDSLITTATFTEPLADSPVVQIALTGAQTLAATAMTKISATQYTYTHTVGAGDGVTTVALSVGTDLSGNIVTGTPTSGVTFSVDNTAPTTQDTVLTSSTGTNPSQTVSITPTGDSTDSLWLAPSGTAVFTAGDNMTRVTGTDTAISSPTQTGTYYLYIVDIAGNISPASISSVTVTPVISISSGGGGGGGSSIQTTTTPTSTPITPVVLAIAPTEKPNVCPYFSAAEFGSRGEKVRRLQTFLNSSKTTKKQLVVNGRFDIRTKNAVMAYQRYHKKAILDPWGFTQPTGEVSITTLKHMHSAIGCSTAKSNKTVALTKVSQ